MSNADWQPARIASHEHVLKFHDVDPGVVTQFAGQVVRVRRNKDAHEALRADRLLVLGCRGEGVEVHPEDFERFWPDVDGRGSLCSCYLLMD